MIDIKILKCLNCGREIIRVGNKQFPKEGFEMECTKCDYKEPPSPIDAELLN